MRAAGAGSCRMRRPAALLLPCPVPSRSHSSPPSLCLLQQDMAAYVDACAPATFNLAFASFAMHHLRWGVDVGAQGAGRGAELQP